MTYIMYAQESWTKAVDLFSAVQGLDDQLTTLKWDAEHEAIYGREDPDYCNNLAEKYSKGLMWTTHFLEKHLCANCLCKLLKVEDLEDFTGDIKKYFEETEVKPVNAALESGVYNMKEYFRQSANGALRNANKSLLEEERSYFEEQEKIFENGQILCNHFINKNVCVTCFINLLNSSDLEKFTEDLRKFL